MQNYTSGSQCQIRTRDRGEMRAAGPVFDVYLWSVHNSLLLPALSLTPGTHTTAAPIAWPIAKLLDKILGVNEAHTYKKAELKTFLQYHRTGEEPLRDDEINILNGVLELNTKQVEEIMTPMKVRLS